MVATACDTGDGTKLNEPTAPTSFPPPDTTPLSSVLLTTSPLSTAPSTGALGTATPDTVTLPGDDASTAEFLVFAPWPDGATIDDRYA